MIYFFSFPAFSICRQAVPEDAGIAHIVTSLGAVVIDVALDGID